MSKRKRERRRPTPGTFPETSSQHGSDRQYTGSDTEYHHEVISSRKPRRIQRQLPPNMPLSMQRDISRTIARLERLAREGKDPPGIQVEYMGSDGRPSTFSYLPGDLAERMAEDLLSAVLLLAHRDEARA
jgi:hypothetical protein